MTLMEHSENLPAGYASLSLLPPEVAEALLTTTVDVKARGGLGPNILQRTAGRVRRKPKYDGDLDGTVNDGEWDEMPAPPKLSPHLTPPADHFDYDNPLPSNAEIMARHARPNGIDDHEWEMTRPLPKRKKPVGERVAGAMGIRTRAQRDAARDARARESVLIASRNLAAREAETERVATERHRARVADEKAKEAATVPERLSGMSSAMTWTHSEMQDHAINALRSGNPEERAIARSLAAQMVRDKNPNVTEPQLLDEVAKLMEKWEGHAAEDAADNKPHRQIGHGSWLDRATMAEVRGAHGARNHIMRTAGMGGRRIDRGVSSRALEHGRRERWYEELPSDDLDRPINALANQYPKLRRAPLSSNPMAAGHGLPIKSLLRSDTSISIKARVVDPDLRVMDGTPVKRPSAPKIGTQGTIGRNGPLPDAEIDGDSDGLVNDGQANEHAAPAKAVEHMQAMLKSPLNPERHRSDVPGSTTGQTLHDWSLARVTRKYGPEHGAEIHQQAMEKLTPYWERHLANLKQRGIDPDNPNSHRALIATVLKQQAARHFEVEGRSSVSKQRLAPMEEEISNLRKAITQIRKNNKNDARISAAQRRIAELEEQMSIIQGEERRTAPTRSEIADVERSGRRAAVPGREPAVNRRSGSIVNDPTGDTAAAAADTEALANADRAMVRDAVRKLPVNQRRAVELAYFEQLSQNEAAARMKMSRNTYASHLSRGLLALRRSLEGRKDAIFENVNNRLMAALIGLADEHLAADLLDEYAIKMLIDAKPSVVRILGTTLPTRSLRETLVSPYTGDSRLIEAKTFALALGITETKARLTSLLVPGSASAMRNPVRHVAISAATPGGNIAGPGVGGAGGIGGAGGAGGIGRPIASSVSKLVHCPSGYQNGGRFSNRQFTNCGQQLFEPAGETTPTDAVPGPARTPVEVTRTILNGASAAGRNLDGRGDYTQMSATMSRMAQVPHVGDADTGRSAEVIQNAVRAAAASPTDFTRLIRRDGVALDARVGLDRLASQRSNVDMRDGTIVTRIASPSNIGDQQVPLIGTGISSIRFVAPGGHELRLDQTGTLSGAEAATLRRQWGTIQRRAGANEGSVALQQLAEASNGKLTYSETFNDLQKPNELVNIEQNGTRRTVPRWVYESYLAESAPGRVGKATAWREVGTVTSAPGTETPAVPTVTSLDAAKKQLASGAQLSEVPARFRADLLKQDKLFEAQSLGNDWTGYTQRNGAEYVTTQRSAAGALADKVSLDLQRAFGVTTPDALIGGTGTQRTTILGAPESAVPGGKLAAGRGLSDAAPADLARIALTDFLLGENFRSPGSISLVGDGSSTVPVPLPSGTAALAGDTRRPSQTALKMALSRKPEVALTDAESSSWFRPYVANSTTSVREAITAMYDNLLENAGAFDWAGYSARLGLDGDLSPADKQHLEVIRTLVQSRTAQLRENRKAVLRALGAGA